MKRFRDDPGKIRPQHNRSRWHIAVLAWWAFLFALITGVILSFNYRPWGDVYTSVSKITGCLPYGAFLRKLHYLSGQFFLLFTFIHTLEHFFRETYHHVKPMEWIKLVLLFVLSFAIVFTGFILKGDKEGILAGGVMYHLSLEIPLIGSGLARILMRPGEDFFLLPYLHHTVILPLMIIFLLGQHRRRLFPEGRLGWPFMAFLALLATFYPLPPDIPPHVEISRLAGPWFFHGIQLLLRHGPAFWAGVVWPLIPIGLLALLAFVPSSMTRWLRGLVIMTWLLQIVILVTSWCLIPGTGN